MKVFKRDWGLKSNDPAYIHELCLRKRFAAQQFGEVQQPLWGMNNSTALELLKVRLDEALRKLTQSVPSLPMAGELKVDDF